MYRVNPSTAQARVIIDELIRCGVGDVVLAPGSRSAPLAIAAAEAEEAGALVLHVRIDERSAGYLALGLAQVTGVPAAVITTSGTAAVNLHPAVTEAHHLGTPMLVLTADRPARLRGVGANQTIDQRHLFPCESVEFALARAEVGQVAVWRSMVARAVAAATDVFDPGPVHLNVPFEEPLVPDGDEQWCEPLAGRADDRPWHADARMVGGMSSPFDEVLAAMFDDPSVPSHGVIVVGQHRDPDFTDLVDELGATMGWPIIAEPSGNVSDADTALTHGPLVLTDRAFVDAHPPDIVVTVGNVGLHRSVLRLIAAAPLHVAIDAKPDFSDPTRSADVVLAAVPLSPQEVDVDESWLAAWQRADLLASAAIETALGAEGATFTGVHVARTVAAAVPEDGLLFLGASWPVRHVSAFAATAAAGGTVIGNRGTSGIDGCVSSAWGAAYAWQRQGFPGSLALLGDLTLLYDSNGLLVPPTEAHPDLVYVIIDNDGGGIFSSLEQGDPAFEPIFDRVFGVPLAQDIAGIVTALGYSCTVVTDEGALRTAVHQAQEAGGVQFVIARTCPRAQEARILHAVERAIGTALESA